MTVLTIERSENNISLVGELTRRTVTKAFEKKSFSLLSNGENTVDLSSVKKVDTAGLAWLLMLMEKTALQSATVKFINISEELLKLAKLSAVDSFLPID